MHPLAGCLMAISSAPTVSALVTDRTVADFTVQPIGTTAVSNVGVRSRSTGVLQRRQGAVYTDISGEWLVAGTPVECEVRFEVVSGVTGSGVTLNTWLAANVDREYFLTATRASGAGEGITTVDGVVRVLYRNASTLAALDQGNITLQANAEQAS